MKLLRTSRELASEITNRRGKLSGWFIRVAIWLTITCIIIPVGTTATIYGKAAANNWKPIAVEIGSDFLIVTVVKGRMQFWKM